MVKKTSYCLGMSLTIEALRERPSCLKEVWLSSKAKDNRFLEELKYLCQKERIPLKKNEEAIRKVSVKENCFAVGVFETFSDMLSKDTRHILLHDFTDEGSLGTCIRSAVSFDFHNIAVVGENSDVFSMKTVRASMGAVFHCRISFFRTFSSYCESYSHPLYSLQISGGDELGEMHFPKSCAIVIAGDLKKAVSIGKSFHIEAKHLTLPVYSALVFHSVYQKGLR